MRLCGLAVSDPQAQRGNGTVATLTPKHTVGAVGAVGGSADCTITFNLTSPPGKEPASDAATGKNLGIEGVLQEDLHVSDGCLRVNQPDARRPVLRDREPALPYMC